MKTVLSLAPFWATAFVFSSSSLFSGNTSSGGLVLQAHDPKRALVLATAYALALAIFVSKPLKSFRLVLTQPLYIALILYALLSSLWSNFPLKVVTNFGHFIGVALVSTVFVAAITKDGPTIRSLSAHLATVLSVFVLFHLVACLVFPELTRHEFTGRWEGLTGNPNTFGPLCTFSVILSLIAVTQKVGNTLKWILLLSVPAAVFALIKTSSVSSIGLLIVGLAFLLVLSTTKNTSTMMRSVVVTSLISLVTLALSTAALVYPEILTAKGFLASIGRDTTLTGRIDLWHVAADLISRKFWFGWSIDSATSVNEILKYEHSIQFHNGYLDLMVRGGAIGTFVAFLLASFNLLKCVRKLKESYALFSSLFVLQLLVLLHNITEASLFRETHQLWLWYTTFIYFGSAYNLGSLRKNTGHD